MAGNPELAKAPERGGPRILVAEDSPSNQMVALTMLARAGYAATAVSNGEEALAEVAGGNYDLVLMDVAMPQMDGLAATREIRRLERGKSRLPIIAMSASIMEEEIIDCLNAGMDDSLPKPFNKRELLAKLDCWLAAPDLRRRVAT